MASSAKPSPSKSTPKSVSPSKREPTVKSTPARNTTVPPKATVSTKDNGRAAEVTREMVAERAYHLWLSGAPGGEFDHWCAAERELNGK